MIDIKDLIFSYGPSGFTLEIKKLSIEKGQTAAFVGPSGCGKTTLLNLICGIYAPHKGSLSILGKNLNGLSENERREWRLHNIGMIFQQFELLEYLKAGENIQLPQILNRGKKTKSKADIKNLAESMGVGSLLSRYPHQLSQGEKQRIAIARALLYDPPLLLADEPTGNLDPERAHSIVDILLQKTRELNSTLIVVTHDHSILSKFNKVVDFKSLLKKRGGRG